MALTWEKDKLKILLILGVIAFFGFSKYLFQKYFLKYIDPHYMGVYLIEKKLLFKEAIEKFQLAIKKNPSREESLICLGHCYEMLGEWEIGLKYYLKAFELNKEFPDTLESMALLFSETGKHEEAIKLINKLEELAKAKGYWDDIKDMIIEDRGWIHYKKGDLVEALKYYDEAIPLLTSSFDNSDEFYQAYSPRHYHLGLIYKQKKEFDKAINKFNWAIIAGGEQCIYARKSKEELKKIAQMQKK